MLYWRNMKIKILIGFCIVGLVGFVVLIIVQTAQNRNNTGEATTPSNSTTAKLM